MKIDRSGYGFVMLVLVAVLLVGGCSGLDPAFTDAMMRSVQGDSIPLGTIIDGLKEALTIGTDRTVATTSQRNGYWDNVDIRIPLPKDLQEIGETLKRFGLGGEVTRLERAMNDAAERAARVAAPVFVDAIRTMTIQDAKRILQGHDSAATEYFRNRTTGVLQEKYLPIMADKLDEVEAVRLSRRIVERYNAIPLVDDIQVDLEGYATDKALDGLFLMLAREEVKIRSDPAQRTTDLLRRVFALQD